MNFTNETSTDVNGLFNWFKQSQVTKYYPGGFTNEATLIGSRFVPPTTNSILGVSNALVAFIDGSLTADFTNGVAASAETSAIVPLDELLDEIEVALEVDRKSVV